MSNKQEDSELKDVRKLEDGATQTRFTWAVIFVALVTVLVGFLTMIESPGSIENLSFNRTISIIYFFLNFGISYTFCAICYTTFIIVKLTKEHETKFIRDFVKKYWTPSYEKLIYTVKKENEKEIVHLKTKTVIFLSIFVGVVSLLPLLFKLSFDVVVSTLIVLVVVAVDIIAVLTKGYLIKQGDRKADIG